MTEFVTIKMCLRPSMMRLKVGRRPESSRCFVLDVTGCAPTAQASAMDYCRAMLDCGAASYIRLVMDSTEEAGACTCWELFPKAGRRTSHGKFWLQEWAHAEGTAGHRREVEAQTAR